MTTERIKEVLKHFNIHEIAISSEPISHGYIHDTYKIYINSEPLYILQQLNTMVFLTPEAVQFNIDLASKKLKSEQYKTIAFISTIEGNSLLHLKGKVFRLMNFVKDSHVYERTDSCSIASECGKIIGHFHKLLEDENISEYEISIPKFHELSFRVDQFKSAMKSNPISDQQTKSAIAFALKTIPEFNEFLSEKMPVRICHNDTKLNNILFNDANKALCLIDLDTIMPGHFHYDFGDAVRTIVNPAAEDEKDLSRIDFNLNMFEAFTNGLKFSGIKLTEKEIELLPKSVGLMPFLHGLRMLTDHLLGNMYYKVDSANQNLYRSRSLFHFTKLAFEKEDDIRSITNQMK